MEGVLQVQLPPSKRSRDASIDCNLCILCQNRSSEGFVEKSKSVDKLLSALSNRLRYGDTDFQQAADALEGMTINDFNQKQYRWHLSCYKRCTHKGHLQRLEAKYINLQVISDDQSACSFSVTNEVPNTRSHGARLAPDTCFFCDKVKDQRHTLFTVSTKEAGENIYEAVHLSDNASWKLKLSGLINPKDAHAYDISYHAQCYTKNVSNVLRSKKCNDKQSEASVIHCGCKQDFITCLLQALNSGKVVSMAEAEMKYKEICSASEIEEDEHMTRKALKAFIENELWELNIEFSNPSRKNESQRICLKATKDVILSQAEEKVDINSQMKTLLEAAKIIRRSILSAKKWTFGGSLAVDEKNSFIPDELEIFFKWCIAGNSKFSVTSNKNKHVKKKATVLSQNLMYQCITHRQAQGSSNNVQHTRYLPLQIGIGLTVHTNTRSKFLVQLLHSFGSSVEYSKVLRLETSIANSVIQHMERNNGLYIPPTLVHGRFIFCAADNLDFLEDMPEGKGTLHATVMACYQQCQNSDESQPLMLCGPTTDRSLRAIPKFMTDYVEYKGPKSIKTCSPLFTSTTSHSDITNISSSLYLDLAWFLSKCISWSTDMVPESMETDSQCLTNSDVSDQDFNTSDIPTPEIYIPTWSAFNSVMQTKMERLTRVCLLPIIPASSTDRSVQLTFLTQLEHVTKVICGNNSKCVVTLDLGLYKPVQQLIMSRSDLHDRWILRPGELHISFAMLRAIGTFIEGTGIPDLWSDVYSESTVNQIIAGKNFRRSVEAHTRLLVALNDCYLILFFDKHEHIRSLLHKKVQKLKTKFHSCSQANAFDELVSTMNECQITQLIDNFDKKETQLRPTFRLVRQYMDMMECLLLFIRSVRTGNWSLHLQSLERLIKYFFALDLTNYSGMIALYLAEMYKLQKSNPDVWNEFESGNWVVNRSKVPFCALGSDEALEHENRSMKVVGGLVGITQHPRALARFFLTAPELLRISEETLIMTGMSSTRNACRHHLDNVSSARIQELAISKIKCEIERIGNPFSIEGPELINLATKVVFSDEIKTDIERIESLGTDLYDRFKSERLVKGTVGLWDPMKRNRLKLCSSAKKKVKVRIAGTVSELTSDRSVFARLLIITRSQRDIDIRETLGKYEMSVVPRSMFSYDGAMHQCMAKSKLIHILKLSRQSCDADTDTASNDSSLYVAIVDGMAELQALEKPNTVKTCADLAHEFANKMNRKYWQYDEVHLVFDTYLDESIKNFTRDKRLHGAAAIQYKIFDNTNIANVSMKKLLLHTHTKDELTDYLAKKMLNYAETCGKKFVVAWRTEAAATHCAVPFLRSTQEEADTKIILHAINAKERGASRLLIFAQDTDVLVLALRRHDRLPEHSYFVPATGERISIREIFLSLGAMKIAALPGFHAMSGCDTTGSLYGKGKMIYWKAFLSASDGELHALQSLGASSTVSDVVVNDLETFICRVYNAPCNIKTLSSLRWWMFTTKQSLGDKLPPTRGALMPAIRRANYQALIWSQDDNAHPIVPLPYDHGWVLEDGQVSPVMCDMPCAPESILQLVKCSCSKTRCTPPCKCVSNNLPCTEMCACSSDEIFCDRSDNVHHANSDSCESEISETESDDIT